MPHFELHEIPATSLNMTPHEFIEKWKPVALTERAAAHSHFRDLCELLGHEDPIKADPTGEWFTFEKGVTKSGGGEGFADVWKRNHFAWEYKKKKRDLNVALDQLVRYAAALENPPLQVACDTNHFLIRTAWTNAVPKTYELSLEDLADPKKLDILHSVFFDPEKLRPVQTRTNVTKEAADKFSSIAARLHGRDKPEAIAHFINQVVFCFFASSVKLLPEGFLLKLLKRASQKPDRAQDYFNQLFAAMEEGGEFDLTDIVWFNGGLFDGQRAPPLDSSDIGLLHAAASLDWGLIDPTVFGTLFERFLDESKRSQIGAHYTDPEKIMMIVEPVILRPLRVEWENTKKEIEQLLAGKTQPPMRLIKPRRRMYPKEAAEEARSRYLERLQHVSILDPACGSGNFLYLALQGVKDIENRANLECEALGLAPRALTVGPEILHGIEINPVAAELARTTIWIGDIQWRRRNGIYSEPPPILRKLDSILTQDAIIDRKTDGKIIEASWPPAEFIIGNPPFLGGKLMRSGLGNEYVEQLFRSYHGRVQPEADLVTYWFDKSLRQITQGLTKRVGLVATNSIRGGANRRVLDRIGEESRFFEAWSDQPWVIDGAAVRVSLICFGTGDDAPRMDGQPVSQINSDLTAGSLDLTKANCLDENIGVSFMGDTKGGSFDISGDLAREWLRLPLNPNGRSNSDVLRPWRNGLDITRQSRDMWIIDFGWEMSERDAALFEAPFKHVKEHVLPERSKNRRDSYRLRWWRHVEPRPAMVGKLNKIQRYIATPTVAKHRVFVWLDSRVLPDHQLIAVTRDDDVTFGILHSRFHEAWALRLGTSLEDRPRYTPTTTFETFPFPDGLAPNVSAQAYAGHPHAISIAKAAKHLDELRSNWLNPPDLISVEPEVVKGYPERILPKDAVSSAKLHDRTLTKLYNEYPHWLSVAHRELDNAVSAAYGWPDNISEDEFLRELLDLNLARSGTQSMLSDSPYIIGRSTFEKISEVEGMQLSQSAKEALDELDTKGQPKAERRRAISRKAKQTTR